MLAIITIIMLSITSMAISITYKATIASMITCSLVGTCKNCITIVNGVNMITKGVKVMECSQTNTKATGDVQSGLMSMEQLDVIQKISEVEIEFRRLFVFTQGTNQFWHLYENHMK